MGRRGVREAGGAVKRHDQVRKAFASDYRSQLARLIDVSFVKEPQNRQKLRKN